MKKITILFIMVLLAATAFSQLRLDVEGNARINGRLEITASSTDSLSLFLGRAAGFNDSGTNNHNYFIGLRTGFSNTSGEFNIALGHRAFFRNTTGSSNITIGHNSLSSNTLGTSNTALGNASLGNNSTGDNNVAIGNSTLLFNTTGDKNTAIGKSALQNNNISTDNTALGYETLFRNTGAANTAIGSEALRENTTGAGNIALGFNTLKTNTVGGANTVIGVNADVGANNLNNATAIGANAKVNASNSLILGSGANVGIGTSNPFAKLHIMGGDEIANFGGGQFVVGNILQKSIAIDDNEIQARINRNPSSLILNGRGGAILARTGAFRTDFTFKHGSGNPSSGKGFTLENEGANNNFWAFYVVNGSGNLELFYKNSIRGRFDDVSGAYTSGSDRKLKNNINSFEFDLKKLDQLKPRSYYFKEDKNRTEYIGFITQEVDKILPQLVHKGSIGDSEETIQMLDYAGFGTVAIAALKQLKKEFYLEKEENNKLQTQINEQQSQIDELKSLVDKLLSNENTDDKGNSYTLPLKQQAELGQNQPNPFHQNTVVEYFIPTNVKKAYIQVTAIDGKILGKVQIQKMGAGNVNIKAHSYPTGTYFYSLVVDGQVLETKRMVLTNK